MSPEASLEDIKLKESRRDPWLGDVESWKELCKRSMVLDNNWAGRGFVLEGGYWSQDGILGFRIDEEQLSEVFLAFPSRFRGIEIWRRTSDVSVDTSSHSDVHAHSTPIKLSPAEALEFEFEEARSTAAEFPLRHSEEGLRGRYTPHACIGAPPNFALASILECVVMDLDVTESYISVCFPSAVVIVPRCEEVKPGTGSASKTTRILVHAEDRPPQLYQEIGMESGKPPGVSRSWVAPETRHPTGVSLTWVAGANALAEMEVAPPWEGLLTGDPRAFYSPLIAARFSPDGRHLAAINAFGLLYLVLNFTRVGHEIVSFSDKVRHVYFGQPLRYIVRNGQPNRLVVQAISFCVSWTLATRSHWNTPADHTEQ